MQAQYLYINHLCCENKVARGRSARAGLQDLERFCQFVTGFTCSCAEQPGGRWHNPLLCYREVYTNGWYLLLPSSLLCCQCECLAGVTLLRIALRLTLVRCGCYWFDSARPVNGRFFYHGSELQANSIIVTSMTRPRQPSVTTVLVSFPTEGKLHFFYGLSIFFFSASTSIYLFPW